MRLGDAGAEAARLLGSLKIEASVYVYDSHGDHNIGGGNGGCGCGCGGYELRDESPPTPRRSRPTTARR